LGGLIVSETEEIPQKDEVIIIDDIKFTILEVSNTKIDTIQLQILSED
jgi:CBS domain containing-hemolysin-like protein